MDPITTALADALPAAIAEAQAKADADLQPRYLHAAGAEWVRTRAYPAAKIIVKIWPSDAAIRRDADIAAAFSLAAVG